jgi:hypothetical protein
MLNLAATLKYARLKSNSLIIGVGITVLILLVVFSANLPSPSYSLDESGKNATKIALDSISDVIFNNTFFAKGSLVDLNTGQEISDATIEFTGNNSGALSNALTAGVIFDDPNGVEVLHFAPGDGPCAPIKTICDTGSGMDVLRMNEDGTISFSNPPNAVALEIQGMATDTFFVEVTIAKPLNNTSSTFYAESFGAGPEISNLNLATLGGIQEIRIVNITSASSDSYVSLSALTAYDPLVHPPLMYKINFTGVEKKIYVDQLEVHKGFFSSVGIANVTSGSVAAITATFEGDQNYNSSSATVYYQIIPSVFKAGISSGEEDEPEEEESEAGQQGETSSSNPVAYSGSEYTSISCSTADDDNDGLCNSWEGPLGGIEYGSGDDKAKYQLKIGSDPYRDWLPVYSDPDKPDVFLEIDYMKYHKPDDVAIQKVIEAFDNAPGGGIELYVVVDEEFPHNGNFKIWKDSTPSLNDFLGVKKKKMTWPTDGDLGFGTDSERSDSLKSQKWHENYLNAKAQAYHYGLFVHSILGTCGPSGHAERPGNDLIVSLGCGFSGNVGGHSGTNYSVGSTDEQAGTLMHELGHNLNLRHGGTVDMNCKANYQSVMSYSRQVPYYFDSGHPWILDYSRVDLATLDENDDDGTGPHLDENSPFGSAVPERYIVWANPSQTPRHATTPIGSSLNVDWERTGNPPVNNDLTIDLNDFGIKGCGLDEDGISNAITTENELGYYDWGNIELDFRPSAGTGFDGMAGPNNEMDSEVRQQIISQTTNVIVDNYSTNTPLANREPVVVTGSSNDAYGKGYKVVLSWGDASVSEPLDIRADGSWGPVQHIYGTGSVLGNPHAVVAELIDGSTGIPRVSSNAFSVIVRFAPDGQPDNQWLWIAIAALIVIIAGLALYIIWLRIRIRKLSYVTSGAGASTSTNQGP